MKTLYKVLNIALWAFLGTFLGSSLFRWWDYTARPGFYEMQSAPWYLSIQVNAILTAIITILLLTAMYFVKKRLR